jgi:thiopeptide-type bacteriocin biosynthesis protein
MASIKRTFIPGDEWLYFKLYTGPKTSDFILIEVIKPIVKSLLKDSLIKKWFFIRFEDPEFHLRIRLHLNNNLSAGEVLSVFNKLCNPHVENETILRIQLDTYQREIERYFDKAIYEFELLSYFDSDMIINTLNECNDELRWLFGLKSIDSILSDFNFTLEVKLSFMEQLKISFCEEFEVDKNFKKQLNKKYAKNEKRIEEFISRYQYYKSKQNVLKELIDIKSQNTNRVLETLKTELTQQQLNSFLSSHIHMMMNRLFRTKQRVCEMVIYYFLHKYYKTLLGREKHYISKQATSLKQ